MVVHNGLAFGLLAPNARAFLDAGTLLCEYSFGSHLLRVIDLDSGVEAAVADATGALTGWAWSPDSSEVLVQRRLWDEEVGCGATVNWFLWDAGRPETLRPVTSLTDLYSRWYGERLVELICPQGLAPGAPGATVLLDRWGRQRGECWGSGRPIGELHLNRQKIDEVHDVVVLGFFEEGG